MDKTVGTVSVDNTLVRSAKTTISNTDGTVRTYLDGQLHSFDDDPAVLTREGRRLWYKNGKLHRDNDLPACIFVHDKFWYKDGVYHRDDNKPAIEYADGRKYWYKMGVVYSSRSR